MKALGLYYRPMSPALHPQCHKAIEMASDFDEMMMHYRHRRLQKPTVETMLWSK